MYYRGGLIGISDRDGSMNKVAALPGEGIDNALAVCANGVFVLSMHAVHGFRRTVDCIAQPMWHEARDRGSATKPGTMHTGGLAGHGVSVRRRRRIKPGLAPVTASESSATGSYNSLAIPVDLFNLLRHCSDIGLAGVDISKRDYGFVYPDIL